MTLATPTPVPKAKAEFSRVTDAGCEVGCPEDKPTDLDVVLEDEVVTAFYCAVVGSRLTET